jgi:hypothetical protein
MAGFVPPAQHSPFYQPPAEGHGYHVTTVWAQCGVDNAAAKAVAFYVVLATVGLLVWALWAWARARTRQWAD